MHGLKLLKQRFTGSTTPSAGAAPDKEKRLSDQGGPSAPRQQASSSHDSGQANATAGGSGQGVQLLPVGGASVQMLPAGTQPWEGQNAQRGPSATSETRRSRPVNLAEVRFSGDIMCLSMHAGCVGARGVARRPGAVLARHGGGARARGVQGAAATQRAAPCAAARAPRPRAPIPPCPADQGRPAAADGRERQPHDRAGRGRRAAVHAPGRRARQVCAAAWRCMRRPCARMVPHAAPCERAAGRGGRRGGRMAGSRGPRAPGTAAGAPGAARRRRRPPPPALRPLTPDRRPRPVCLPPFNNTPAPLQHHSIIGSTEGLASYILLAAHGTGAAELERDVVMKGADWSPFQLEGRHSHLYLTAEDDDQVGGGGGRVGGFLHGWGLVAESVPPPTRPAACIHKSGRERAHRRTDGGTLATAAFGVCLGAGRGGCPVLAGFGNARPQSPPPTRPRHNHPPTRPPSRRWLCPRTGRCCTTPTACAASWRCR